VKRSVALGQFLIPSDRDAIGCDAIEFTCIAADALEFFLSLCGPVHSSPLERIRRPRQMRGYRPINSASCWYSIPPRFAASHAPPAKASTASQECNPDALLARPNGTKLTAAGQRLTKEPDCGLGPQRANSAGSRSFRPSGTSRAALILCRVASSRTYTAQSCKRALAAPLRGTRVGGPQTSSRKETA
jgi:hypothetical protein